MEPPKSQGGSLVLLAVILGVAFGRAVGIIQQTGVSRQPDSFQLRPIGALASGSVRSGHARLPLASDMLFHPTPIDKHPSSGLVCPAHHVIDRTAVCLEGERLSRI